MHCGCVFYPLGNDFHAQIFGQIHNGLDDGDICRMPVDIQNKAAVNFDHIGSEVFEVRERGVAGAKIVQGHPRANAPDLVKKAACADNILQRHAFCDLQANQFCNRQVLLQKPANIIKKLLVVERSAAEVDAHETGVLELVLVLLQPFQCG